MQQTCEYEEGIFFSFSQGDYSTGIEREGEGTSTGCDKIIECEEGTRAWIGQGRVSERKEGGSLGEKKTNKRCTDGVYSI